MNGKKGPVHIDLPKCVIAKNINLNDYYNYNNNLKEKFSYNFYYSFNNNINHIYNKDNHDNNKDKNVIYLDDGNSNYDKFYTKYNNILIKEKNIDNSKIKNISKLINKSEKPVIIVGKGCNNYHNELRKFAISANIPVTTTIHAMGCFDETHNLSLDFLGMHGNVSANYAVQNADLIINLGSRFVDRITGNSEGFAPKAFEASKNNNGGIIHVNIEPSEINKVIDSHFNFNNDCGTFLNAINDNFIEFKKRTNWFKQINYWKEKYPFKFELNKNYLKTQEIISELNNYLLDNNIDNYFITTGVGNHQMMASQFIKWKYPNTFISSGSLGVMGAGLPYSIGCQIANPNSTVINLDGDGSINHTLAELKTIKDYDLPIKIAVFNDGKMSMVKAWEKLFYEERYVATDMKKPLNYKDIAESFGIKGIVCDNRNNLKNTIKEFMEYPNHILCDFRGVHDLCLPLVAPGANLDDLILHKDQINIDKDALPPS